jgi:hypothetical protein
MRWRPTCTSRATVSIASCPISWSWPSATLDG